VRWTLIKSRLAVPLEIYRTQKSILEVGRYFGRLISRRGPSAIRRRIETRRSLDRLATKASELEANIRVAALVQGALRIETRPSSTARVRSVLHSQPVYSAQPLDFRKTRRPYGCAARLIK
jgi:hypothetical protein